MNTIDKLIAQRADLQFRHDNSAWESGPEYRAKIAKLDDTIRELRTIQGKLSPVEFGYLEAIASTEGKSPERVAADMTRNGRDLATAINAATHTLMNHPAYAG